jgi:hypothetical protein
MSSNQHQITNLRGEKITGTVRVRLKPGFGIQIAGEHIEGGPHDVPVAIAQQLLESNRADAVFEDDVEQPTNRDPAAESRDPRANRRR